MTKAKPLLVSVITICMDNRSELLETLETLRSSNLVDYEHCVVDGSVESLLSEDEISSWNLKYIRQRGHGISDAFNLGVHNSSGKWLWFLNSGDHVHKEFDYQQWQETFSQLHSRQVLCGRITRDKPIETHQALSTAPRRRFFWGWTLFWRNRVSHPGTFVGRQVFDSCGLFDTGMKIAMDYEFWLRCTTHLVPFTPFDRIVAVFMTGGISTNPTFANELRADERLARYKNLFRWLYLPLISLPKRLGTS